jgi:hypothetical protein
MRLPTPLVDTDVAVLAVGRTGDAVFYIDLESVPRVVVTVALNRIRQRKGWNHFGKALRSSRRVPFLVCQPDGSAKFDLQYTRFLKSCRVARVRTTTRRSSPALTFLPGGGLHWLDADITVGVVRNTHRYGPTIKTAEITILQRWWFRWCPFGEQSQPDAQKAIHQAQALRDEFHANKLRNVHYGILRVFLASVRSLASVARCTILWLKSTPAPSMPIIPPMPTRPIWLAPIVVIANRVPIRIVFLGIDLLAP